jgi:carbonic anhydrase
MCQYCDEARIAPTPFARRNILKFAGAAAAALALGGPALAKEAKMVPKPQNVLTPDAALERLMQGNKRYVDGLTKRHNFAHEREALTK